MSELTSPAAAAPRTRSAFHNFAFVVVAGTTILLTLFVDERGQDSFRLPKEILFRAGALALAAGFAFAFTSRKRLAAPSGAWRRPAIVITAAAVVWTLITAFTSTVRADSIESLITVCSSAILFLGMLFVFSEEESAALDFVFAPAIVNAVLEILQEYGVWQPFTFPDAAKGHSASSALIGNPNDVGAFLIVPAVAAAIATTVVRGTRRVVYSAVALVLLAGIVASGTRTALVAYVVSLAAFVAFRSRRNMAVIVVLVAIVAGVAVTPSTALGSRTRAWREALANRQYDVVFSQRLPPFLAAIEMWRDHPITGVGPGGFKHHYMLYRLSLDAKYPAAWLAGYPDMFGETHNDALQLLAETGVGGVVLFLAAIAAIALPALHFPTTRDTAEVDFRRVFARELRVPLAAAILVAALAQFPLQIAAPRTMFLYFAALCFAWDEHVS